MQALGAGVVERTSSLSLAALITAAHIYDVDTHALHEVHAGDNGG